TECASLPLRVKDRLVRLDFHRSEPVHPAEVVHTVHADQSNTTGSLATGAASVYVDERRARTSSAVATTSPSTAPIRSESSCGTRCPPPANSSISTRRYRRQRIAHGSMSPPTIGSKSTTWFS